MQMRGVRTDSTRLATPTTRRARAYGAANCVFALPELWDIIAEHSGLVGAWRLTGVCRASRVAPFHAGLFIPNWT